MNQMLTDTAITCPACHEKSTQKINEMSGKLGYIPLKNKSYLFACYNCNLFFRWPYITEDELEFHYSKIGAGEWDNAYRIDQEKIVGIIKNRLRSGSILDIGCFRGDFLCKLPGNFFKYGVEPSVAARKIAQRRRIKLIGRTLANIAKEDVPKFDVITAIDLIEHVQNPLHALEQLERVLKTGGYLIVSTGNADALTWRLLRENYWYYFTEHVSFTNPKWFRWAGYKLNLTVEEVQKFAYYQGPPFIIFKQFVMAICYRIYQTASRRRLLKQVLSMVWPFSKVKTWKSSPITRMWPDHMIVVLRKR